LAAEDDSAHAAAKKLDVERDQQSQRAVSTESGRARSSSARELATADHCALQNPLGETWRSWRLGGCPERCSQAGALCPARGRPPGRVPPGRLL